MALEKGFLRSSGEAARVYVVGSGRWWQVILDDMNSRNRYLDCSGVDGVFGPDGKYRLSLPFSRRCLLNSLNILNNFALKLPRSGSSINKLEEGSPSQATFASNKNSKLQKWIGWRFEGIKCDISFRSRQCKWSF